MESLDACLGDFGFRHIDEAQRHEFLQVFETHVGQIALRHGDDGDPLIPAQALGQFVGIVLSFGG